MTKIKIEIMTMDNKREREREDKRSIKPHHRGRNIAY